MLRIAEHFHDSDLGRQRQGNEDNYYVRAPLFVVADGMGGAQAGEVASEIAVRQFEGGLPDDSHSGEALVALIQEANARIHEQARSDAQHAGMGTTPTAAYLTGDTVVGALVARGKLTEEQAESHPQRSVITRALGPEPHVEVDVDAFPARPGDVFLLCSDGLTSMVHEPQLKPLLTDPRRSLEQIGRALIAAANDAGGRDNITVILFRVEEVEDRRGGDTERADSALTVEHEAVGGEPERGGGGVALQAPVTAELRSEGGGTAAPAGEPPRRTAPLPEEPRRPKRRRLSAGAVIVFLAVVLPLIAGGWLATRAVYFIGTDPADDRTVAIFRGLPYELPFGIELYERYYKSGVTLADVPPARRASFTNHALRSRDDAEDLVIALEKGEVE